MNKNMNCWKLVCFLLSTVATSLYVQGAVNHNPYFDVSNVVVSGTNYIFIGEDDSADYGLRTNVTLKYRDAQIPDSGTTTLEWTSGGNKVFAFDTSSGTTPFDQGMTSYDDSDHGKWEWTDSDQDNFENDNVYFQGKADHVSDNSEVSYSGDTVTLEASHSDSSQTFSKNFTLVKLNIDAIKVSGGDPQQGQRLEESEEESSGAFLPVNNDDDDYDLTADNSQSGGSGRGTNGRDTDLLPVQLVGIGFGDYTLVIPSHLKVWSSNDRTGTVTNSTSFSAANDTTLYVEGDSQGSGQLKIDWSDSSSSLSKTNADRIVIEAFEWGGPLNVPGNSIYEYTVSSPPSIATGWTSVSGGSINSGANTSTANVLWNSGPTVGEITYSVNDSYSWVLEVNVVGITVGTSTILYDNPAIRDASDPFLIYSADAQTEKAMDVEVVIDRIEGPVVDNEMRGLEFMEIGIIQLVDINNFRANFDDLSTPMAIASDIEGNTNLLDGFDTASKPWYDATDQTGSNGVLDVGADLTLDNSAILSQTLNVSDTPRYKILSQWDYDFTMPSGETETDRVDGYTVTYDFNLYLAVRTSENVNGADSKYYSLAHGSWTMDASGDYDASNSSTWTADNAFSNTGSGNLSTSAAGTLVPSTGNQNLAKDELLQAPMRDVQQ